MAHRRSLPMAGGMILALVFAACAGSEGREATGSAGPKVPASSAMAKIQRAGKIKVGIKFDQPLFGQKSPVTGEVEGFDAEIARELAREITGSRDNVEFVETVSKNREPFIQDGKVDMVIATYSITPERKQQVSFAGPYYVAGQDTMVRAEDASIRGVADLSGRRVCTLEGSTSEQNLRAEAPGAEVLLFDTWSKCASALADGRVDAASGDNAILLGLVQGSKGAFRLVGRPFTREPYGIGLMKGADQLRTFVNDALERMFADGRWRRAYASTVGQVDKTTPRPPQLDR